MISEYDFERLMIQQYVLYKKLVQIQDKVNGRTSHDLTLFCLMTSKKKWT